MLILKFIHLLSLVIWIGGIVFFSFVAAPAIFKTLPRAQAGDVVAKIFPIYYKIAYVCGPLSLGTLLGVSIQKASSPVWNFLCIALMTVLTFYSGIVIGRKVRQLKKERNAASTDVIQQEKEKAFKKLHGISMALNMLVLMIGMILIFLTSLNLQ
ncbi:MAG: DUF4149 domain-containing protein [Nitrospiria bacterium]